jgi:hypothetical protein
LWIVVSIVIWEAVDRHKADHLYDHLKFCLPEYGIPMEVILIRILFVS